MPSTARKVSKRSSTPTGAYTRATASRTRSETVRPCLRASDLRRWCRSSSRYSWVRCIYDVYTSMYIHCQSKAMQFSRPVLQMATENHGNPTPPPHQWCFPRPSPSSWPRIVVDPVGGGEPKSLGKGGGPCFPWIRWPKSTLHRNLPDVLPATTRAGSIDCSGASPPPTVID